MRIPTKKGSNGFSGSFCASLIKRETGSKSFKDWLRCFIRLEPIKTLYKKLKGDAV